jgi:hypothetical protein
MTPIKHQTEFTAIFQPYRHKHIEVIGRTFTGPKTGQHLTADFDRPSDPVSFSLIGEFWCEYPSGPNLLSLSNYVGSIVGPGFYGLTKTTPSGDAFQVQS